MDSNSTMYFKKIKHQRDIPEYISDDFSLK